jgi:hypothetical protein
MSARPKPAAEADAMEVQVAHYLISNHRGLT